MAAVILGAAAAAIGWVGGSGLAWIVAVTVAALGYGIAIELASRRRVPAALTACTGLAAWLAVSTLLAHLGVLGRHVELALVAAGILANALPRRMLPHESVVRPRAAVAIAVGGVAGIALIALALVRRDLLVADGFDHTFVVKRLWDLGALAAMPHQLGARVVGEAYCALATGAASAEVFSAACAAWVIWLIATELRARDRATAELVFSVAIVVIVLRPLEWPIVLFAMGAYCAQRRGARWHALVFVIGLITLRNELVWLALPYAIAQLDLSHRGLAIAGCAAVIAVGIATGAAVKVPLVLAAAPLGWLVLRLLGTFELCSPLAVASIATLAASLAARSSDHDPATTTAIWFAFGLAILVAIDQISRPRPEPYLRYGAASIALMLVAMLAAFPAIRQLDQVKLRLRWEHGVIALRDTSALDPLAAARDAYEMQLRTPAGASIAFDAIDAAELDFQRNPIRYVQQPVASDYLIFEAVAARTTDPWLPRGELVDIPPPDDRFELVASAGLARLYRLRR